MSYVPMGQRVFTDNRWLHIVEFERRYGVSQDLIYQNRFYKRYPQNIVVDAFVDTHWFINRIEFRERVRNEAHKMYYYLTRYWVQSEIAYMLHKVYPEQKESTWNTFMSHELFAEPNPRFSQVKTPLNIWRFFRFARSLVRWALRKIRVNYFEIDTCKVFDLDINKKAGV